MSRSKRFYAIAILLALLTVIAGAALLRWRAQPTLPAATATMMAAVMTATPLPPSPTLTAIPPTPTIVPTISPTPTPLPPSATPTLTLPPTATPTFTPSPTPAWLEPAAQALRPEARDDVARLADAPFYDVELRVALEGEPYVTGSARVTYRNRTAAPLAELVFRLYPNTRLYASRLTIQQALVNGQPVAFALAVEDTALRLPLDPPLLPGEGAVVELAFATAIPVDNLVAYRMINYAADVVVLNDVFPLLAVHDAQGWDLRPVAEQGDALSSEIAFFQVRLTAPREMVVAASGVAMERHAQSDGTATWSFVTGPARTVAIVMSDRFEMVETTVDGITVRSYYLPQDRVGGEAILQYAADALRVYGARFGPYPYTELDVVEAPIGAGGMESPGLITVQDQHYTLHQGYAEFLTAHEVAHQWWYNLVGNHQQVAPWIDESLTNYCVLPYYQEVRGPARAAEAKVWYLSGPYELAREAGQDLPINLAAEAYPNPIYYRIVYAKGGLFYDALQARLGDERFFAILRDYADAYRWSMVTEAELLGFWRERAGQGIEDLIEQWVTGP